MFTGLSVVVLVVVVLCLVLFPAPKKTAPGPVAFPLIGTAYTGMHQLSRRNHRVMTALTKKYGKFFQMVYPMNMQSLFVVADPALVKEILTRKEDFSGRNQKNRALTFLVPNGLLGLPDNEMMRNHRRLMTAPLFNREFIESYMETINQKVDVMIELMKENARKKEVINIKDRFQLATLDVILKLAFAYESDCQRTKFDFSRRALLKLGILIFVRLVLPEWIYNKTPFQKMIQKELEMFHSMVDRVVLQSAKEGLKNSGHVGSILEAMLIASSDEELKKSESGSAIKMSPAEFKDEALSIMGAGHETTANTLTWSAYLLSQPQNKHVVHKLHAEIEKVLGDRERVEYADLEKLKYCEAVFMETLRCYPTVPGTTRYCPRDTKLAGCDIPGGVRLSYCVLVCA
jgi:cytochrome P450